MLLYFTFGNQLHRIFDLSFKVLDQDYGTQLSFSQQLFGCVFRVHREGRWWLFLLLTFGSVCSRCEILIGLRRSFIRFEAGLRGGSAGGWWAWVGGLLTAGQYTSHVDSNGY